MDGPKTDGGSKTPLEQLQAFAETQGKRLAAAKTEVGELSQENHRLHRELDGYKARFGVKREEEAAANPSARPPTIVVKGDMTLRHWFAGTAKIDDGDLLLKTDAEQFLGRKMPDDAPGRITFFAEIEARIRFIKANAMIAEGKRCQTPK